MRHKFKKEALDVIVQKITNDGDGIFLTDLLKISEVVRDEKNLNLQECLETHKFKVMLKNINWLYGYENEVLDTLEAIKSKLEKKVFNKDAFHVTIISCMACYSALVSILDSDFDVAKWRVLFEGCENKRLKECLEMLSKHCPEKIDVDGFCEARRYIRLWDSEYNW